MGYFSIRGKYTAYNETQPRGIPVSNPFQHEDPALDEAIASALTDLKSFSSDEEGFQKTVQQLSELYKLKYDGAKIALEVHQFEVNHTVEQAEVTYQRELENRPFFKRVDPNTAVTVLGNIFIGLAVIKYEQTGVISSKVMSFMKKI